jgi:dethiobiotin synthetase
MGSGYFITGTDTNVGKTWVTVALMRYFKSQGQSVVGMKPVASGCFMQHGELKNLDALLIQENASVKLDYSLVNPYAYALPVSPHIAGVNDPVDLAKVSANFSRLMPLADTVLVEGAGGWYAPINNHENVSDLALILGLPVILVVAIRLGCINHAQLSAQAILQSGLPCAGWVAVCTEPQLPSLEENIQTLTEKLPIPRLAVLPYLAVVNFDCLAQAFSGSFNF